uniref:Uncharacterized protein n=1 Tax=viral metagenome TaxID=1070528 RepID=A0A6H1ZF51_9ZZZZ
MKKEIIVSVNCGDFWVSQKDLPDKEPIRSIMVDIIGCDASCCGNKKAYLRLVKATAKEIVKRYKIIEVRPSDKFPTNNN